MAENRITVKFVFKPGPAQQTAPQATYSIEPQELERLIDEMNPALASRADLRAFTVFESDVAKKIIFRLDDLLYIG